MMADECVVSGPPWTLAACDGLQELSEHGDRGKGVRVTQRVNMETHQPTRQQWALHSGDHSKRGMVMNHCPVCGVDLTAMWKDLFEPVEDETK